MIEQRKNFIINSLYLTIMGIVLVAMFKFTFNHLMPFVVGFFIAFILKPIVRKFDHIFGQQKWIGVLVTILFYSLVLFLIVWAIFGAIGLIQHAIPLAQMFFDTKLVPMANELMMWAESFASNLDPRFISIVERGMNELMNALETILNYISSGALTWITAIVSSTPKILVAIILSVISSFFFSMDYDSISDTMLKVFPFEVQRFILDFKNNFVALISQFFLAYGKLMALTFVELAIGLIIFRVNNPISRAAIISLVDILPVLGTGTVLIPWGVYELLVGSTSLGIGLIILYVLISAVRYVLEPRVVGKQIGLHPLLTLVSIYIGVKFIGFWGIFVAPVVVTIFVTMIKNDELNFRGYFRGEAPLINSKKVKE